MADITKCSGHKCPDKLKKTCYRFLEKPSLRQAFFLNTPYNPDTDSCEHYWEVVENNKTQEWYPF